MTYDPKVEELVRAFFEDSPHLRTDAAISVLSNAIQYVIEDYLKELQERYDASNNDHGTA